MTDIEPRRFRLYAWVIGIAAAFVVAGYMTADKWLAFVAGLLVGA